ncbi:TIGR00269 family protein [Syntrophorhabdus aromaticivorans]|uniref:TIGR00269 family protein n=1 Tax=Syntrophorhabdus aromaticivorans TaxID=328301 RepID=A0A971M3Y6_9BACT|nr:TIGR00269 family protein [Syntrophorhabdus aromaticivorans]NLW35563.1 TIGR00269 family protein [Syntrophorhabdus aromaticivorans]
MKCRVCGQEASIGLRAYNTALCADDFIFFLEKRVSATIRKYHLIETGDTPIVAVSGGKDSLSVWHILNRLGYPADGIYVDLGIGDYSRTSLAKITQMAEKLQRKVYTLHVRDIFERGIDEVARAIRRVPCSACGMIKRYVMNKVCIDRDYNVLVTGHNLDDEAAALLGNLLYWKDEYLWKKSPSLESRDGHLSKKVKPLFLCSEREMAAYAVLSGIDYIYEECPFSVDAKSLEYKGILNNLEESSPGTKLQFIKGYLKRMKVGKKNDEEERDMAYCDTCGYPCYGDKCNMCRLLERFHIEKGMDFDEYDGSSLDSTRPMVT